MPYRGNPGGNALAKAFSQRIQMETSGSLMLDFGSIEPDFSLKTNTFPQNIPKTDYLVCRSLTTGPAGGDMVTVSGGAHGGHESGNGGHSHVIPIPEKMRSLKPGDRVLVAWVDKEAVVVDIIVPAAQIQG